jgi:hypothetical protein
MRTRFTTTTTSKNRKEGWRNDTTNQYILAHPPRGVHVK